VKVPHRAPSRQRLVTDQQPQERFHDAKSMTFGNPRPRA
jgi:hypothetical protein